MAHIIVVKSILDNKQTNEEAQARCATMNLFSVFLEVCFLVLALWVNSSLQDHDAGKYCQEKNTKF